MELKLNPSKIAGMLMLAMTAIVTLHIIACLPMYFMGRSYPLGFLSLDGEYNLPTMFSTALLWCNALLVGCIAWAEKNVRLNAIYWWGLAIAFLAMGMDEAVVFHERIIDGCRQFFNASEFLYFAWVIPYTALTILFILIYLRFFCRLPVDTKKHILWAVILYIGGAIGFEMLGGAWMETHRKDSIYYLLSTIEEILEMLGSIAFIYAFSTHIDRHLPNLSLRITSA